MPGSPRKGGSERGQPSPPTCPLLAPGSLKAQGPCPPSSFQATDEDSPPNNQITYSIVNASAFGSYFDIRVYEGYAGTRGAGLRAQPGEEGWQVGAGLHITPVSGGSPSVSQTTWTTWEAAPQLLSSGAARGMGSPFHRLKICVSVQPDLSLSLRPVASQASEVTTTVCGVPIKKDCLAISVARGRGAR